MLRRVLLLLAMAATAHAAERLPSDFPAPVERGFAAVPEGPEDAISEDDRKAIWKSIDAARARLQIPMAEERPALRWPLRAARGYWQPGFNRISNYVDHDPAFPDHVRDYNCGSRSYDRDNGYNHQGVDISIFPDSWNTMQTGQIEIIAAAPGTIVYKADGNFDRNCAFGSGNWNAVYVQHDDGSIAWYGHMKSGSLTAKAVGARVATGEYLGNVGSSGNSTGPHLHFEVYDANRRLIDPFHGACNVKNSESWWAEQPAYTVTRVNRALTAAAAPVFSSCGADGRMQDAGTLNTKVNFTPGETVFFVAAVRDVALGQRVGFTIRRPDGTVWRQYTGEAATQFYTGAYWWVSYQIEANAPAGTWLLDADLAGTHAQSPFTVTASGAPIANYTDLWWNPAENGWGVNLNHQGDSLFATWFTYDTDRQGLWLVMSDARLQADGSFAGTIYRATGVPMSQIHGQPAANFPLPAVGSGTFRFSAIDRGTFSYTVGAVAQQKAIQRAVFSTPPTCVATAGSRAAATNYQDLWGNPSERGWGINLAHQGEIIFATWFTFGAGGRGQWLIASDARRQATGEFRGRVYRTTGTPFGQIAGTPALTANPDDVGSMTLTFTDGENGRLDYTVDGDTQSKAITRQVVAATTPLCR